MNIKYATIAQLLLPWDTTSLFLPLLSTTKVKQTLQNKNRFHRENDLKNIIVFQVCFLSTHSFPSGYFRKYSFLQIDDLTTPWKLGNKDINGFFAIVYFFKRIKADEAKRASHCQLIDWSDHWVLEFKCLAYIVCSCSFTSYKVNHFNGVQHL